MRVTWPGRQTSAMIENEPSGSICSRWLWKRSALPSRCSGVSTSGAGRFRRSASATSPAVSPQSACARIAFRAAATSPAMRVRSSGIAIWVDMCGSTVGRRGFGSHSSGDTVGDVLAVRWSVIVLCLPVVHQSAAPVAGTGFSRSRGAFRVGLAGESTCHFRVTQPAVRCNPWVTRSREGSRSAASGSDSLTSLSGWAAARNGIPHVRRARAISQHRPHFAFDATRGAFEVTQGLRQLRAVQTIRS